MGKKSKKLTENISLYKLAFEDIKRVMETALEPQQIVVKIENILNGLYEKSDKDKSDKE